MSRKRKSDGLQGGLGGQDLELDLSFNVLPSGDGIFTSTSAIARLQSNSSGSGSCSCSASASRRRRSGSVDNSRNRGGGHVDGDVVDGAEEEDNRGAGKRAARGGEELFWALGPATAAAEIEAGVEGNALAGARLGRAGTTGGLVSVPRTGGPVLSKEEAEKRRRKHVDLLHALYAHISVSCSGVLALATFRHLCLLYGGLS